MADWIVEQVVHFAPGDFVRDGLAHFGFHDRGGRLFAIAHQSHFLGLVDRTGRLVWTVAGEPVFAGVPNIAAVLDFPMYVDAYQTGRCWSRTSGVLASTGSTSST